MMFSKENQKGDKIQRFADYIEKSRAAVAITGAGISVSAGGVTYRQLSGAVRPGLRNTRDPEKMYSSFFRDYVNAMFRYKPSPSHYALKDMEQEGKLIGIITTNEDCMHTLAGSRNVAEIQGSFQINRCSKCGKAYDRYEIWNEDRMPVCTGCGGAILPWQIYSGVGLYDRDVEKARKWIGMADLIIVIGTNGYYGSAYWHFRRSDAVIVQINPEHTGFDRTADLNIREECDDVFAKLAERRRENGGK